LSTCSQFLTANSLTAYRHSLAEVTVRLCFGCVSCA